MAFPCNNVRCAVNREGMCLSAFVNKPEDCDDYLEIKAGNKIKDILDSATVNKPTRTELTANEKIALELLEVWGNLNMNDGSGQATDVLETYTYFKDKLNKEDN